MAYVGEARFRFKGPAQECSRYIPVARVLVERVSAMYAIGSTSGADAATHSTRLADGTVIKITVFTQAPPIITITTGSVGTLGRDITIDNGFYFYNHNAAFNAGPRYTAGNVTEAYAGNADDGSVPVGSTAGKWKKRKLPAKGLFGTYRFLSEDLRVVDDYPAWLSQWWVLGNRTHYHINGKQIEAPGNVIGAIKDRTRDAVFTATLNPARIHRYDRAADDTWALTWTTDVPFSGGSEENRRIERAMQINPAGTEALFTVIGIFTAPSISAFTGNDSFGFVILFKADLVTGTLTYIYGNKTDVINAYETEVVTVIDGDFPDGAGYYFANDTEIEAGVTTSVTLRHPGSDPAAYIAAPRVGDNFYLGSNPDPNSGSSSRLEVTAVSYTPEPYDMPGQIYTGSVSPQSGSYPSITFTWIKVGQVEDPPGSGTFVNSTYPAGSSMDYICKGNPTLVDYYIELTETYTSKQVSQYFGYDSAGVQYYAYYDHRTDIVDSLSRVGTNGDVVEDGVFDDSGQTELVFVGGENNGVRILWGNQGFDFSTQKHLTGFAAASDANRFSGLDFYDASGTVGPLTQREVAYPPSVPYGVGGGEVYVYGDSTDVAEFTQKGYFDAYTNTLYRNNYGRVYDYELSLPAAAIATVNKLSNAFQYTGAGVTATVTQPYKEVRVEDVRHKNVLVSKFLSVKEQDLGSTYADDTFFELGGYALASMSYSAVSGLREYKYQFGSQADHYPASALGAVASDPFHNVISLFERRYNGDGDGYVLKNSDYGYLWRARDGFLTADPRAMFTAVGDVTPVEDLDAVYWGVIVTDVTVGTTEYANPNVAQDTRTKTYTATYRPA